MFPKTTAKFVTGTVLAVGLLAFSLQATAQGVVPPSFSGVYVFGDSLSDGGNNGIVFGGQTGPNPISPTFIASQPYAAAPGNRPTYSNGPVWFNSFAAGLGLGGFAAPSLAGGGNYAFGGARTTINGGGVPPFIPAPFPASVLTQLTTYLSTNPAAATAASSLYVIAGGGNDARAVVTAIQGGANPAIAIPAGATAYATATAQMVGSLRAAGALNIIVWNVPDLGLTPAALAGGAQAAAGATFISSTFNSFLSGALANTGAIIFDLFGSINGIVNNPSAAGFGNVTQACGFSGNNCSASNALFWDAIHPTAFAQTVVAGQMLATVAAIPEPATVWLFMAGLAAFGVLARRRQQG